MIWWSGYLRSVRWAGRELRVFVRRVRCRPCAVTAAVLPSFLAERRFDPVEVIGGVVDAVVGEGCGVRPAAGVAGVPHTTARGWVRRFRSRAVVLAVAFAALVIELGGDPLGPSGMSDREALSAIGAGLEDACCLPGWAALGRWRFASTVCGGALWAANTTPPSFVVGNRRFIPPTPQPEA